MEYKERENSEAAAPSGAVRVVLALSSCKGAARNDLAMKKTPTVQP